MQTKLNPTKATEKVQPRHRDRPEVLTRAAAFGKQNKAAMIRAGELRPFGPQSRWSVLLGEREFLREEIDRGRLCLERLQRDVVECRAPLCSQWAPDKPQASATDDTMVAFLSGWLLELEDRFGVVIQEIDAVTKQGGTEPKHLEESMFALLRAAG